MRSPTDLPISADTNVDELLDRFPETATVFVQRRMQCVGCSLARFETVADVCEIYRQALEPFLRDLNAAASGQVS